MLIEGQIPMCCLGCGKNIPYYLKWCSGKCKEIFKSTHIKREDKKNASSN